MTKRKRPEQALQRAVCAHLRARAAPGVVWFHVPNGGYRSPREAAEFKRQGVLAGVSDLLFLKDGNMYALELKADRGKMSIPQMEFRDAVNSAGGYATFAVGIEAALAVLKKWELVK